MGMSAFDDALAQAEAGLAAAKAAYFQAAQDALDARDAVQKVLDTERALDKVEDAAYDQKLSQAQALIKTLQAQLNISPPTPDLTGWKLLKTMDLSVDEGWQYNTGVMMRDSSYNRREQAHFGTGPDGKCLTVVAEKSEDGKIYSADMKFTKLKLPSYFRAEVVCKVSPMMTGLWPAPMWFRPNGPGEGEIDLAEFWGKEPAVNRYGHFTAIWTPYDKAVIKSTRVAMTNFGDPSLTGEHTWTIEKTPGVMRFYLDGRAAGVIDKTISPATWDAMWEAGTQWYPRVTFQVGLGKGGSSAGPLDPSFTRAEIVINSMKFWSQI